MTDGPQGVPLGRALDIPTGLAHEDLRRAVAAIERVHGDGALPRLPMRCAQLDQQPSGVRHSRGRLSFDLAGANPRILVVDPRFGDRAFTAVHEIGHLLDVAGIGRGERFASSTDEQLQPWRECVAASDAFAILGDRARGAMDINPIASPMLSASIAARFAAEALLTEEVWARSYAQYIAVRSADQALLASLNRFRRRPVGGLYFPLQWDDDDFVSISEAIDEVFRGLGWRTTTGRSSAGSAWKR